MGSETPSSEDEDPDDKEVPADAKEEEEAAHVANRNENGIPSTERMDEAEIGESSTGEIEEKQKSQEDDTSGVASAAVVAVLDESSSPDAVESSPDFSVNVHDDNSSKESAEKETAVSPQEQQQQKEEVMQHDKISEKKEPPPSTAASNDRRNSQQANRRRRKRRSRVARIENTNYDESNKNKDDNKKKVLEKKKKKKKKGLPIPSNQYECLLVRRAVKRLDPATVSAAASASSSAPENNNNIVTDENGKEYEIYGDISLGMKLSFADTGEVIVEHVTPLADGRASPAQLTGLIKRGDILLSIDGVSITENPLQGVNPLKAPEDSRIPCQRTYRLRFAAGEGHEMLQRMEAKKAAARNYHGSNQEHHHIAADAASEVVATLLMVDQLSGVPLFDEQLQQQQQQESTKSETQPSSPVSISRKSTATAADLPGSSQSRKKAVPINEQISQNLATIRLVDRNQYLVSAPGNTFGALDNSWLTSPSSLLVVGSSSANRSVDEEEPTEQLLTLPQRHELGLKAMLGARNILKQVENIDAGKDLRSFQSWNTTLSLYSRASTRRRRVFDAASLPLNFGRVDEEEDDDDSSAAGHAGSEASSGGSEQLDGDELLLRLAAHDEIWRTQVIEFLEKVGRDSEDQHSEDNDEDNELPEEKAVEPQDTNAALSSALGNFLFGDNMTKILAKNKTPRSLPSEEVTAVLFDLTTKISSSVPDEIKAASGSQLSTRSGLAPTFTEFKRHRTGSDVILATQFLLDEALPAWLKSFRPLAWEHRRILWPVERSHAGGSTTAASTISDDSLTVDSRQSESIRKRKRAKNIQEIIEDQELNIETRGETCFLTTFYFIHALLPRLLRNQHEGGPDEQNARAEIVEFLGEYGSYLKLHTCLAYAAVLRAETVIDLLLGVAKYDPRHREVIKQTSKSTAMIFYEPTMLSAVLQLLNGIQTEKTRDRKLAIINLCSAAYPDIRSWQVKRACQVKSSGASTEDEMQDLYYTYLSHLLHPQDGHDAARRDAERVKEWCELSVRDILNAGDSSEMKDRRENFFAVASRTTSHHLAYRRDLTLLLTLSMQLKEYDLALDLAGEILDDPTMSEKEDALQFVLENLRLVGVSALDAESDSTEGSFETLKRILRLFGKRALRQVVDVPSELLKFLEHKAGKKAFRLRSQPTVLELVEFFSEHAIPGDLLKTLALSQSPQCFQPELFPVLHRVLCRGASVGNGLSTSLLRIKQARGRLNGISSSETSQARSILSTTYIDEREKECLWKSMSKGLVSIEK